MNRKPGRVVKTKRHAVERPPQFVMIAFDNCTDLERWQDWTKFIEQIENKARFTFFLSGTNFLADSNKAIYRGPKHRPGESEINFGGSVEEIKDRVDYINALYNKGHKGSEFASHAVGHFHAEEENWSASDWVQEFKSYNDLLNNIGRNNHLPDTSFDFPAASVRGFRAPFLETGEHLGSVLHRYRYRYDTSVPGAADAWPVKDANGIWGFDLASIPVAGYPATTLSMDYNFLMLQSGGKDDPDSGNWPRYRQEMFDAYAAYLKGNYEGNRAPIHIGHHFAEYQGGVYKEALMAFVKAVCTIPEVKCVTYSELHDFLSPLSAATLAAYQRGDFPKKRLVAPGLSKAFADAAPIVAVKAVRRPTQHSLQASLVGADRNRFKSGQFEWRYLNKGVGNGPRFDAGQLPRHRPISLTVIFRDSKARIRWRNTFSIRVGRHETKIMQPTACCDGLRLNPLYLTEENAAMRTGIRKDSPNKPAVGTRRRARSLGGDVAWEQIVTLIGQRPGLMKDVVDAARKAGTLPSQLNWSGVRLGRLWNHLSGRRVSPYECAIGGKSLSIGADLNFYDPEGKTLSLDDGSAEQFAVFVVESSPTLTWTRK